MASSTVIELAVEMTCDKCVNTVEELLSKQADIRCVSVDLVSQRVTVESNRRAEDVKQLIETTGIRTVITGLANQEGNHLGTAVAMISSSSSGVMGVIRFIQIHPNVCRIDGTVDGLLPGLHGLHIHEYGDISNECDSCGSHFDYPDSLNNHGSPDDEHRHIGDLGNIEANTDGRAAFTVEDTKIKVWDIIGRSIVVTEHSDDLGRGINSLSKIDGNSGNGIACGIIARSAGVMENTKKICQCDGVIVWDERDKPLAGHQRKQQQQQQ